MRRFMPANKARAAAYWKEHANFIPHATLATDQKTIAERKWREGAKPSRAQKPCDIGLFNDDASQLDLVEMFQQPTNEE